MLPDSQTPDLAIAHHQAGRLPQAELAQQEKKELEEAIASYRRAVQAASSYQRALQLKPDDAEAHNNFGSALQDLGRIGEATASYRRALQLKPDFAEAYSNLGIALKHQGHTAEAIDSYRKARQLRPGHVQALNNLLCVLHYGDGVTPSELAREHADFQREFAAPLEETWTPNKNDRDPDRKLRLGFISPDLHRHPVGYFLIRVFEKLDPEQAETVCYKNSTIHDDLTARIQAAATAFRDVSTWNDEQLAGEIRADRIDILFDLAGHTAGNRLLVFARKPAPIQMTWAGYVGTTGLRAMDYIVADRHEIPPEAERYYCERVLRMPDAYICYESPDYAPPVSSLPALEKGHVTFASFNNPAKISAQAIEVWARILLRLPQTRLVLKYTGMDDIAVASRLAERFTGHGVDSGRVECLGWTPHADALKQYQSIDIGLDTFPYGGGLTTCEALWMGVPVITCPGETFASRHSLTHLSNVGLTQTIARDLDEYVDLAVSLAGNLPHLAELRAGLRERMAKSPLCDGQRFADNLIRLLRNAWREWVRRQAAPSRAESAS